MNGVGTTLRHVIFHKVLLSFNLMSVVFFLAYLWTLHLNSLSSMCFNNIREIRYPAYRIVVGKAHFDYCRPSSIPTLRRLLLRTFDLEFLKISHINDWVNLNQKTAEQHYAKLYDNPCISTELVTDRQFTIIRLDLGNKCLDSHIA